MIPAAPAGESIEPLFGHCLLCDRPVWKPGEFLCIWHDIQAQIALGYEQMSARIKRRPDRVHILPKKAITLHLKDNNF